MIEIHVKNVVLFFLSAIIPMNLNFFHLPNLASFWEAPSQTSQSLKPVRGGAWWLMDGMFMAVFRRKGWIWEERRPKNLQKNLSAFCDSEAIIWEEPGHPPWGTQNAETFRGWLRGLPVASRIELSRSYRASPKFQVSKTHHPSIRRGVFSTNMAPPRWLRVFLQPENSLICRETGFQDA